NLTPANTTMTAGSTLTVGAVVHNYGSVATGQFSTRIYVSPNSTFDSNAQVLATFSTSSLAAGATTTLSQSVTLPSGLSGSDHLIVWADYLNQETETRDTDNSFSVPITITAVATTVIESS